MDGPNARLTPDEAPWLSDAGAQMICAAIEDAGHAVYFVGGCVRNAVLGTAVSDIDLSTDALPSRVTEIAKAVGLKAIPTGIDHGTVTIVKDGCGYEITTFRKDVATDGRRAVVAFSDSIADDAARRDFTMNALYATRQGEVIDPLGGLPDLHARRVRFIGDAEARIQEDYLRILRFFRFHAWYGDPSQGFDPDALAAISANTGGLSALSVERIGAEIQRLLSAGDPAFAVAGMEQAAVLSAILPGATTRFLGPVVHIAGVLGLPPDWLVRLAALGGAPAKDRLRLSKADATVLEALLDQGYGANSLPEIAYRYGMRIAQGALLIRSALSQTMPQAHALGEISTAAVQTFPVRAADLPAYYEGRAIGIRLGQLEDAWIASGFKLGKTALLELPD